MLNKNHITKGEMLNRIFNRLDTLQLTNKMRSLFLEQGLQRYDLTDLKHKSEASYRQWKRLNNRHQRLIGFTTYTVLEKQSVTLN